MRNTLGTYKEELRNALNARLEDYENRIKHNPERKHGHVDGKGILTVLGYAQGGSKLGQYIPGFGQLIGALVGGGVGLTIVMCQEIDHLHKNMRLDNAGRVHDFLVNEEAKYILGAVADRVIDDRANALLRISHNEMKHVVTYLAVNIMAAIKHAPANIANLSTPARIAMILNGLEDPRSSKEASHTLKDNDGHPVCTSAALAKLPGLRQLEAAREDKHALSRHHFFTEPQSGGKLQVPVESVVLKH